MFADHFCQHLKTILYAESPKPFKTFIQMRDTNCCELKPGQPFRTQLTPSVVPTSQKLRSNSAEREFLPCYRMSQFSFNRHRILIYKPDLFIYRCSGNDSGFPWYTFFHYTSCYFSPISKESIFTLCLLIRFFFPSQGTDRKTNIKKA